ncbi:hypothetical protein HBI34_232450 [Parastagonospora nodorum]|nr:hypothetical protein HBI34_232450 [Parastagonospora nodorum]
MISSNSILQINIREGYRIITLEVVKLIENLISYLIVAKYTQLQNAQIPKVFYKAAYSAKIKTKNLSNMLTLILSKTAQQQSSSIISNRSIALITNKFSVALLTKLAILNNANIALVDAMHYSVIDTLIIMLIKNDDDLLGTVNSYIKLRRLRALGKKAQLKKTKNEEELAKAKKEKEKKELIDAYILYFKELLSNNSEIFANAIGIGKTRAIIEVQNTQAEGNVIEYNAVNNNDKLYSTKGERTFYCANSSLKNISRLTKEEAIEMQINTTNAISKALAATNKLVALQSYVLEGFIIVCSFRKVDKYIFRAYNTISVTAQRTIIRKGSSYIEKRFNATNKRDSVTSNRIYKIEDAFKTYSSCKVKRFTLNSVKNLFTNLSKDYFLSITAEDAAKIIVALIAFTEAIILTEATHVLAEIYVSIVYFNLDSKLELKVLSKQDVKITS